MWFSNMPYRINCLHQSRKAHLHSVYKIAHILQSVRSCSGLNRLHFVEVFAVAESVRNEYDATFNWAVAAALIRACWR